MEIRVPQTDTARTAGSPQRRGTVIADEDAPPAEAHQVVIIGAGPAGLTAAYELTKKGVRSTVLESEDVVGGISRTVERDGWRFDIGGHRFFTKVKPVEDLWVEILGKENFLLRPRMSRIYYRGKLFDYPLRAFNALSGLGLLEAIRCFMSYFWVKVHPPKNQSSFEGWTASRFGWRLYRIFFKTYTEKVWGIPANEIQADWAAQRIKNLNLMTAVINAMMPKRNQKNVASLIEEFNYPKYGPGMMWEYARDKVEKAGSTVLMNSPAVAVHHSGGHVAGVTTVIDGKRRRLPATSVVSSMPFSELVLAMDPPAPAPVQKAARSLRYRDFLTVALIVPKQFGFPDNWIYIHDPGVSVGRIQNFGSWSPYMVKDGKTCLGMEFFVTEGDPLWTMSDADLIALAKSELVSLDLAEASRLENGYVVRVPKAYPLYDDAYKGHVATINGWLQSCVRGVYPVGRNGMHKYNNQDHSMYTAMLSVENILGGQHDVWAVNVDEEYHEEKGQDGDMELSGSGLPAASAATPREASRTREATG
ncbi:MAG: NAD(P)/FAD-dependent oxidoreductase [Candidatus Dormibacteraeota bacterium]|uniref:NAD(P)/FAD-dependent oxidoreductase n=1 Tax=Candidatus Amunia macphersoniae TaxID=3127014 RepID=A0A934KQA2_9BACT|nr:NAD(P)/FAD-dependent oxidoreductase [Candidatus Dormibacteraeota bacterium]